MEVAAKLKGARISAQKARLVADEVRGMPERVNHLQLRPIRKPRRHRDEHQRPLFNLLDDDLSNPIATIRGLRQRRVT